MGNEHSITAYTPALERMLHSEEFSDLTFTCGGEEIKVHKVIVCSYSKVIRAAVTGGFQEAETGILSMDDFKLDAVRSLVEYMYLGGYNVHQPEEPMMEASATRGPADTSLSTSSSETVAVASSATSTRTPEFLEHIRVHAIGYFYDVQGLVSLANANIKSLLAKQSLKQDPDWKFSLLVGTAEAIESTEDDELLDMLAMELASQVSTLINESEFERILWSSEFVVRVMKSMLASQSEYSKKLKNLQYCVDTLKMAPRCKTCQEKCNVSVNDDESFLICSGCRRVMPRPLTFKYGLR